MNRCGRLNSARPLAPAREDVAQAVGGDARVITFAVHRPVDAETTRCLEGLTIVKRAKKHDLVAIDEQYVKAALRIDRPGGRVDDVRRRELGQRGERPAIARDNDGAIGYEVLWRRTTAPNWTNAVRLIADSRPQITLRLSKDDHLFAVRAVADSGARGLPTIAGR